MINKTLNLQCSL